MMSFYEFAVRSAKTRDESKQLTAVSIANDSLPMTKGVLAKLAWGDDSPRPN